MNTDTLATELHALLTQFSMRHGYVATLHEMAAFAEDLAAYYSGETLASIGAACGRLRQIKAPHPNACEQCCEHPKMPGSSICERCSDHDLDGQFDEWLDSQFSVEEIE